MSSTAARRVEVKRTSMCYKVSSPLKHTASIRSAGQVMTKICEIIGFKSDNSDLLKRGSAKSYEKGISYRLKMAH